MWPSYIDAVLTEYIISESSFPNPQAKIHRKSRILRKERGTNYLKYMHYLSANTRLD